MRAGLAAEQGDSAMSRKLGLLLAALAALASGPAFAAALEEQT